MVDTEMLAPLYQMLGTWIGSLAGTPISFLIIAAIFLLAPSHIRKSLSQPSDNQITDRHFILVAFGNVVCLVGTRFTSTDQVNGTTLMYLGLLIILFGGYQIVRKTWSTDTPSVPSKSIE